MAGKSLTAEQSEFLVRLTRSSLAVMGIRAESDGSFVTTSSEKDEALIRLGEFLEELRQSKQKDKILAEVIRDFSSEIDAAIVQLHRFLKGEHLSVEEIWQIGVPIRGIANAYFSRL